jgi:hypothetical protein
MSNIYLPEQFKIVSATAGCVTTNGGVTFDVINLENAHKVWIVAHFKQAVAHATTIQPVTGISFASCATSITFSARWWKNVDISLTDTLVAQTAATSMACAATAKDQLLVIEIDPSDIVAQSKTYTHLGATIATSGQATDFVSAIYYIKERYPQATPPTAIV